MEVEGANNSANFLYGRWLASPPEGEEVVISGISGRLPESNNIQEYQENLFSKKEMVTDDDRRWKLDHRQIPQRNAKIYNIEKYDAGFFGLHYRQADIMDPIMRQFMETAVEAIMDAGVNPAELEGSKTGVFVGVCYSDTENHTYTNLTEPQKFSFTGYLRSMFPHRVSYYLKLKGPSYVVDTACSSSGNALDQAFKAIRSGKCDSALVGGCNLLTHPGATLQFFRLGVLSSDGRCKVFDNDADGYVRGECATCVFLQKAKNARRIYAQIINTKGNSDGFKEQGITFPSNKVQKILMEEIYDESNIHPSTISFLEAHSTGTGVGDLEEVDAIDRALARKRHEPLLIGSVKCSIGHTEPGSALCSLFKVLIAMETGKIAPNINLKKIKVGMEGVEQGRMKVVTELTDLEGDGAVVGINNFGFGGSNSHVILRRFKKTKNHDDVQDKIPRLVCLSGRNENSVLELIDNLNHKPLDREHVALFHQLFKRDINNHLYRGYTIISQNGPIKSSCKSYTGSSSPFYISFGQLENSYQTLGKYLFNFPSFKTTLSKINKYLLLKDTDIMDSIFKNENSLLGEIAVQIGIVDLLKELELKPTAVYAHPERKLISAYHYDAITLKETVSAAYEFCQQKSKTIPSFGISELDTMTKQKDNHITISKNTESDLRGDFLSYEDLKTLPKSSIIWNISDEDLNNRDKKLVEDDNVKFLEALGELYQNGYNPQLYKLYPEIKFPVSRSTPMISPLIKWNHDRSWYVYKFTEFTLSDAEQTEWNCATIYDEFKYICGHVIDGRNLVPATTYLHLVWQTFAHSRRLLVDDVPVVFENCKFIKAVTMPKASYVKFLVTIQRGTGYFEVLEKDSIVVHGTIYSPNDISYHQSSLPPIPLNEEDPTLVLEKDEIYKELYLRGYNYSGMFKGISKCNIEASTALVKWESNWSTFMDKMLQLKILQTDTRLLYVPVGIKKLSIDPATHQAFTKNEETLLPVYSYKESNIIKSGGIEIRGLQARSIYRRKSRLAPVLEKYMFLPNNSHLSLKESVRVNVQVILENSLETNFKAVEILDDGTKSQLLSPLIFQALEDLPLITPNLIVSSKTHVQDIPGITIEDFVLVPESNLLLITGTKILQKTTLKSILVALDSKGFILTREDTDFIPPITKDLEIMTQHVTGNQKLILLRKVQKTSIPKCIEIFSESLNWLPELQKALKEESEIVVYSQNQELSGIIGLVNCIRREPKGNKVKCFFMVDEAPEFDTKNPFYGEQLKKNLAINVYMGSQWGTYRHLLLDDLEEVECEHIYGNTTVRGDLSSLKWIEGPLSSTTSTKSDKKMIYNYYSSINFKDIMVASGRVNVDVITSDRIEQENILGFEFSGRDLSGRRYCGMINSQAISTQVIGDTSFLWEVPNAWSLEDAATVPVVYSTVSYALLMVTTLKPGTSILIHSATGGIGIAAINVCLYYGCEIFVTVGTHEKREYLKKHYPQIKDDHIGNSHDTSFEEMIKTVTRGRGVDIVLNSLTDDKLKASIRCLARGGRFMEIGKFDLANDTSLELLLMEREVSYHGIMLDQIFIQQPEVKKELAKIIFDNFENGFVKPLPKTVFEKEKIEDAFRYMTTGKHVGKVLIKIREEEPEKRIQVPKGLFKGVPRFNCNTEKTYIIIGGLGGIGMELADWLILRGAKKLVLVSTSGVRNGYQTQRLRIWDSYGVTVQISKADITSPKGCFNLIEEANLLGPIDGIFNLAVVLEDALFEDQSEEKFRISLEPKAVATTYLDEITRHLCPNLRYFVIFSSVSCGRGNAGQTNYGMANSIMERICEKRKREGFPALAVQWGAIGEVGLVAKMQKENRELVIGGTLQQKISSCLEVLDKFLKQDSPIVSSMVVAEKHTRNANSSPVDAVAQILGIKDIKTVSQHCILPELGMDSIMGTEIIQVLERDFELYITPKELRNLTLAKLIELEAEGKINKELKNLENETNVILPELPRGDTCKSPIVRLPTLVSADEKAPTVFLFAGIGGVFNVLEDFTSNLKAHVFGLQYSFENPEDSIQEVAKSMLPLIESNLVKEQSFNIIGYSFGSLVALEVTNLLEDKGFTGNFIAIDGTPAYLAAALKYFVPFENDAEFQTHLFFKLWTMTFPIEILAPYKEKVIGCSNYNDRIDLLLSLIPEEFKDKFERKAIVALYKRFKASLDYRFDHDKIKSTAYLFKAKKPIVTDSDASYNLTEVCDNLLQVTTIDGDHLTMLKQQKLFEIVNQLFENM